MKKKVRFGDIKAGECFRLTENGPIYMKSVAHDGQCVFGKSPGKLTNWADDSKMVFPAKVKISEVK